jgi:hypothetical protein
MREKKHEIKNNVSFIPSKNASGITGERVGVNDPFVGGLLTHHLLYSFQTYDFPN